MIDLSGTFDTTNALSGMYMWLIFGYLSHLINCDLQRFMYSHALVTHLVGLTAFFFLFTLIDSNTQDVTIWMIWLKTFFIYGLFILMTKSKWYFVVPVLILLLVDQTIKKMTPEDAKDERVKLRHKELSSKLNIVIIIIIITGSLHYMYLQWLEYKSKFDLAKFFFSANRKCKLKNPKYKTSLDLG